MKGKLANGVGSQYSYTTSERGISSITNADAQPRLPAVDWTDSPADLNGLVRLGERRNVVSARVPSRSAPALPSSYGYRVFPVGKVRPGRDADPSPPSIAEVKNRVEL